jgi:hypothetical protein
MIGHRLPPIHDAVRLWERNDVATLRACIAYRKRKLPGWTLAFLREKASYIFSGELNESALRQAVRKYVPPDSQKSVLEGLDLLLRFIERHRWQGKQLPPCDLVFDGLPVQLRPIGIYSSNVLKKKCVLALQPRLEDVPTNEQFRIWLSAMHYRYCKDSAGTLSAMIVDLSKNPVSGKRELREITSRKFPLLPEKEMNARFQLIASSYGRAIQEVPDLPLNPWSRKSSAQKRLI